MTIRAWCLECALIAPSWSEEARGWHDDHDVLVGMGREAGHTYTESEGERAELMVELEPLGPVERRRLPRDLPTPGRRGAQARKHARTPGRVWCSRDRHGACVFGRPRRLMASAAAGRSRSRRYRAAVIRSSVPSQVTARADPAVPRARVVCNYRINSVAILNKFTPPGAERILCTSRRRALELRTGSDLLKCIHWEQTDAGTAFCHDPGASSWWATCEIHTEETTLPATVLRTDVQR